MAKRTRAHFPPHPPPAREAEAPGAITLAKNESHIEPERVAALDVRLVPLAATMRLAHPKRATHWKRRHARLWTAIFNCADEAQGQSTQWLPAHKSLHAFLQVSHVADSRKVASLWRANRLADAHSGCTLLSGVGGKPHFAGPMVLSSAPSVMNFATGGQG